MWPQVCSTVMEEMHVCVFKLWFLGGGAVGRWRCLHCSTCVNFLTDAIRDEAKVHAVIVNAEHVAKCTNKLGEWVGFMMWR